MKVITLYIGSVIGAGYASGQEILQFFIHYGKQGIFGVIVATILFAYLGMVIMYLSCKMKTGSYHDLLKYLISPLVKLMDLLSMALLVGGLGVMFAGSGAVFNQYLNWPEYLGSIIALLVTIVVLWGGAERVINVNLYLVPIKVLAIWIITLTVIGSHSLNSVIIMPSEAKGVVNHWLWASILYISYNMVVSMAVLTTLGKKIQQTTGVLAGLVGGIILGLTTGLITWAGLSLYPQITQYPVPMLFMAETVSPICRNIAAFLIWLAMITTAIVNAHGFAARIAPENKKRYQIVAMGVCLLVYPLTTINFIHLVKRIYPCFGYAGLLVMVTLLIVPWFKLNRS